mmetsp:Transcript_30754/g.46633  ORF Transcript_30754/g.46633 Transcript_30754/m.46633 type:complete len:166 (+) Transcript_30754:102-599(+)
MTILEGLGDFISEIQPASESCVRSRSLLHGVNNSLCSVRSKSLIVGTVREHIEFHSHLSRISAAGSTEEDSLSVERDPTVVEGMIISFEAPTGQSEGLYLDQDDFSDQVSIHLDEESEWGPSCSSEEDTLAKGRLPWSWFWKQRSYLSNRDHSQVKSKSIFVGVL